MLTGAGRGTDGLPGPHLVIGRLEHCQACGPGGLRECSDEAVDIHATGPVDSDDVRVATLGADVIGDGQDRAVFDG